LSASITGLIIGVIVGIFVGTTNTCAKVVHDGGSKVINLALELASQQNGLEGIQQKVNTEQLRIVLDRIQDIKIDNSTSLKGAIINWTLDRLRKPFLARAKLFLGHIASTSLFSLSELTTATWADVQADVQSNAKSLTLFKIGIGYAWLLICAFVACMFSWFARIILRGVRLGKDNPDIIKS
jgi:hypothetical protein